MRAGERQVAPTREGIRRDHVARYSFAARTLPPGSRVLDLACGVGYGSQLLAEAGHTVIGLDVDAEAIAYAEQHYVHDRVSYRQFDASRDAMWPIEPQDAAVCFETIEHIEDPRPMLRQFARTCATLLASVPNEEVFPWQNHAYHFRHYTPGEFNALLEECGWRVVEWYGQQDAHSEVKRRWMGRTIIAHAVRTDDVSATLTEQDVAEPERVAAQVAPQIAAESGAGWGRPNIQVERIEIPPEPAPAVPEHVAILGLGPSLHTYMDYCRRAGSRHKVADETWAINALGDTFICDRVFHMDDVRIQEIRAAARPHSNIAAMLTWLRKHPGPIYTSRPHADYPGLVAFPLEDVANKLGFLYFNNTAAYALAYAIFIGVKKVSIFGCDYTYPNAHDAEKGRGCLEFWLGQAAARGIKIAMPKTSSLMDACYGDIERIYGYDTVEIKRTKEGELMKLSFVERPVLPTAAEIEARYDHSAHPNPLVTGD